MNNYTKGEWKTGRLKGAIECNGNLLAACFTENDEENQANAQLIASAPDLYEALKALANTIMRNGTATKNREEVLNGIKALAKAEGK